MRQARNILEGNWTGAYTKPSPALYPHQWNWDSGFVAIGYAHYDEKRAMEEIRSLFRHQWENGMVPQIVFNPKALGHYFPEPDFWQVPDGRLTSGITMPPIHSTACLHIFTEARDKELARRFLKEMFPKLVSSHRYLYKYRDPQLAGLVCIRHPWESGLDNSPAWDGPLRNVIFDKRKLPHYERKDLKRGVPPEQRPSDNDYDRYVYLVDIFRKLKYNEEDINKECPFLVQDVLFNSILCRANRDLVEIGQILEEDVDELEEWEKLTSGAISEDLWCEGCKKFESVDSIAASHIHTGTVSSFMPLFAGAASKNQAQILYETLNSVSFCALRQGNCFTIPNYDMTREDFDSSNYWRGPVWININWMLCQGLKGYGFKEKADSMKRDIIQLPIRFGFYEYFDSQTGHGYGSSNFSWTAGLFLDLVFEYYEIDESATGWLNRRNNRSLKERVILNEGDESMPAPPKGIAPELMASISDLREKFYDFNRGRVDYDAMRRSPAYAKYKSTAANLRHLDPATISSLPQKKAFWINLYNAIVVHGIVELKIQASVRELADFFTSISYQIGSFRFSAEEIEHGILRANSRPPYGVFPVFRRNDPRRMLSLKAIDPRIHFALVCGSRSCAPIRFYDTKKIDRQLETAAEHFVNSSEVMVLPERNKMFLSQIFRWYRRDFGNREQLFRFLIKYMADREKGEFLKENMDSIKIEYLFYDWNLNH